jgi:hypothetical protein
LILFRRTPLDLHGFSTICCNHDPDLPSLTSFRKETMNWLNGTRRLTVSLLLVLLTSGLQAETPVSPDARKLLDGWAKVAQKDNPKFQGFSAEAGRRIYYAERVHSEGDSRSCATCHAEDPAQSGRNASTGKVIDPLSPAVNPERFTKAKDINKWFKRNCKWVLERECTAEEKGHFTTYMLSL